MREWNGLKSHLNRQIVLASASPRRRELLGLLGLDFVVEDSGVLEETDPAESPAESAARLARQKAEAVTSRFPDALVLGADTVVVIGREILGKPVDREDARRMLRLLRNRWHFVITGLALIDSKNGKRAVRHVETGVRMAGYSDAEIEDYVSSDEPLDKAGSYAIQGLGGRLVTRIEGCYTNVVGLPVCEVAEMLREYGVKAAAAPAPCADNAGKPCPRLE
ncbi:MAG: septum formation inhibitor Maf [Acidobacteria bacterium]|nr:MAG: septum formation inhibitor Maf [Acidobacteriota bacterium]